MRKISAILLASALLLTSCTQNTDDVISEFVPSDNYGTIIPYIGRDYIAEATEELLTSQSYGFCTPEGDIVMEAGKNIVDIELKSSHDDFTYYLMTTSAPDKIMYPYTYESYIIPESGKWIIPASAVQSAESVGDGIIIYTDGGENSTPIEVTPGTLKAFDYDGNALFTLENIAEAGHFSCGLMNIVIGRTDNTPERSCYIDTKGNIVLDGYNFASPFSRDGVAYVSKDGGETYHFINTSGEKISESYSYVWQHENGYYECINGEYCDLISPAGELLYHTDGTMLFAVCENDIVVGTLKSGENEMIWKRLSDGSNFVCADTGKYPDNHSDAPYFSALYDENSHSIFGYDGKTVALLENFTNLNCISSNGSIIVYESGAYENVHNPIVIYDNINKKALHTLENAGDAYFVGKNERYIMIEPFIAYIPDDRRDDEPYEYHLFDTVEKRLIFEGLSELRYFEVGGKGYFAAADSEKRVLYDEELEKILEVPNR